MYNKITPQKLKWLYIFKYFFQLIIYPLFLGGTFLGAAFTIFWIRDGYDQACLSCLHDSINFLGIKNVNSAFGFILMGGGIECYKYFFGYTVYRSDRRFIYEKRCNRKRNNICKCFSYV